MNRSVALRLTLAAVALLACAAAAGCQPAKPVSTGLAPDQVAQPEIVKGTLPGLELVDPSTFPTRTARTVRYWIDGDQSSDNRPVLKKGSYQPLVANASITSVELTTAESDGIYRPVLRLTFDPAATKVFSDFTSSSAGKPVLLVINGTVFAAPTINIPITDGIYQFPLTGPQKDEVKAAIAPSL